MTRRWAPPTRYTLQRNTANIIKIWMNLNHRNCEIELETRLRCDATEGAFCGDTPMGGSTNHAASNIRVFHFFTVFDLKHVRGRI